MRETAATLNDVGRGQAAAVYGPVASFYYRSHHPWLRQFIGTITSAMFPEPSIQVDSRAPVDVALRRTRDGRLSVHLLNTGNRPFPDLYNFADVIPPLRDIRLVVLTPEKPRVVIWHHDS